MQAIITEKQQVALIKKQAVNRLTRSQLAEKLNLARTTVKDVLDKQTPFVVSGKTFTAVNDYLLEDLQTQKSPTMAKWQGGNLITDHTTCNGG